MAAAPLTRPAPRPRIAATALALVVLVVAGLLGVRPAAAAALDVYRIMDVSQTEGTGGTTTFTFTVTRISGNGPGSVAFTTAPGTAQAGSDYTTTAGTLNFTSTIDSRQIVVPVNPDATDEPDETFNVVLTPAGVGESCENLDCTGQGTIRDDDGPEIVISNAPSVTEGNTGETAATFTVTLKKSSPDPVTVHYATSNGTATTADGDYDATSGDLTFTAGQTSKTVTVNVNGDIKDEVDENFFVNLTNPSGGTISDASGEATIVDDDALPVVSIAPTSSAQTASTLDAVVTLSAASGKTVTVHYSTADGTATAPEDYTAVAAADGVVTFLPGETTKNASVSLVNDNIDEPAETFTITLSSPTNATIDPTKTTSTATISDDDPTPTININDAAAATEGTHPSANFAVTLSNPSSTVITVAYATADVTATAGQDYTAKSGTVTFQPGDTSESIIVPILNDTADEAATETFNVDLSDPSSNAQLGDDQGVGTITDNDGPPTLSIDNVTHDEGNAGVTAYVFAVTLSTASGNPVSVHWATANDTATTADSDYTAGSGTLNFAAGETSKNITVNVTGDTKSEPNEAFFVNLDTPTNASIADGQGIGTITNDDPGPKISIDDINVTEGSGGTTNAVFTVTLDSTSTQTIDVPWSTVNGSATSPSDYTGASGTVSFAPGDQSEQIFVVVKGDTIAETDETFTVHLGTPTGGPATFAKQDGTATIPNDDGPAPTLTINDVTQAEGNSGTTTYTFTVTRSGNLTDPSTVDYTTANDTATAPADYTAKTGTLSFAGGASTATVDILVNGETTFEANEAFKVVLSNARDASISDDTGVGTITNDDATPAISINDVTLAEGNSGTTAFTFTVSLTNASSTDVKVDVATALDTAQQADFTPINPASTLTIPAGSMSVTVTVDVVGDTTDEDDETFFVNLTNPVGATIADGQGLGTITDDDAAPGVSISSPTLSEGNAGTTNATFTLTLSAASGKVVTVRASTADGTATVADSDYVAKTEDFTFSAGETTKSFVVVVNGDTKLEGDETFTAALSNGGNTGTLGSAGTATVTNDDAVPTISVDDLTVTEGNAGTANATFTVRLSNPSSTAVTVSAATADGTATASDYTGFGATTLTFPAGSTSQQVTATVTGDAADEANETFFVNLSSPTGATIADNQATATITDDDATPTLTIGDASTTEGNTVAVNLQFTVTLTGTTTQAVSVDYATSNGTATAGSDYTATSGTLTFNPGETSKTITVAVAGDTADEADETVTVTLSNATNATLADGVATGTINDDDEPAVKPDVPQGYSLVGEDGSLYAFGTAKNLGDMRGTKLNAPIIGVAYTPGGNGYWLVARDGGIFTFGDAEFFGSMGDKKLNSPVIGMAATPTGKGYWLFAGDGGIFTFGDAEFFGSMGDKKLNAPVINMEPLASGRGYWLVAADGGIFTFGLGEFFGSMGDQKINQPVFDMTSTDSDNGYWLVARDGGIFSFGDAAPKFFGSAVNENPRPTRVIGMDSTPDSQGYWIADASGKVYRYGNAQDLGDRAGNNNPAPMVAFASVPSVKQAA